MSLNLAQRYLSQIRESSRGPRLGETRWARDVHLMLKVLTPSRQQDVGAKGRLGLCRDSGEGGWPKFPWLRTGAAKRLAEVFASPETRGA
jgi:hypothetical protein